MRDDRPYSSLAARQMYVDARSVQAGVDIAELPRSKPVRYVAGLLRIREH